MLVAKLAMVELAGGMGYNNPDASFTGPGRSPWNPDYWSGGSSSGSGAATAAGLVALRDRLRDLGLDPHARAFCGLSGLRPDLRPACRATARWRCAGRSTSSGPMCRTADDCGPGAGGDRGAAIPQDPTTVDGALRLDARRALHAALPHRRRCATRPRARSPRCKAELREVARGAARRSRRSRQDVRVPRLPLGPRGRHDRGRGGRRRVPRPHRERRHAQAARAGGPLSAATPRMMTLAVDYLEAMRARVPMRAALDALLARYDALVAPDARRRRPADRLRLRQAAGAALPASRPTGTPPRRPPTIPAGNLAGRARGLRAQRLRRARPAHLAAAPRARASPRRRCSISARPLPAGDRLARKRRPPMDKLAGPRPRLRRAPALIPTGPISRSRDAGTCIGSERRWPWPASEPKSWRSAARSWSPR